MDGLPVENWRPVVGYEGLYEVSDLGRVKRVKTTTSTVAGRILKQKNDPYARVGLMRNGEQISHLVHALVAEAFIGPRPEGAEIDHIHGDKLDNRPCKLEYVTPKENVRRAAKLGLRAVGERSPKAKLTGDEVLEIRRLLQKVKNGEMSISCADIGKQFNVVEGTISHIKHGRSWTHVQAANA